MLDVRPPDFIPLMAFDPSENRKAMKSARANRSANSFEMVAREWFAKSSATWAANHGNRIIRRFDRDIFPWIGGRPIAEVTAPEPLAMCGGLKTGAHWKPRTGRWADRRIEASEALDRPVDEMTDIVSFRTSTWMNSASTPSKRTSLADA